MAILVIAGSVSQGIVTSVLWRWFVARQFHIPPISSAGAIGIVLLIRLVTLGAIDTSDIDAGVPRTFGEKFWTAVGKYIIVPFLLMGFGWVVLHFMH